MYSGPRFNGPEYQPERDGKRLQTQLNRIKSLMSDGAWRTLGEIEHATGDPAASISAQLRHLRKCRFGSYRVERKARGETERGLYEYRVLEPNKEAPAIEPKETELQRLRLRVAELERENDSLKRRLLSTGCLFCRK